MSRDGHGQAIGLIAAACAVAISACGSANGAGNSGTGTGGGAALTFANCMRSHGVPSFPDPGASGGFSGVRKQAPAFRSAMQTCNRLHPSGRSTGTALTEAKRLVALAQVRCLRDHGMPNFPDPTFPSTGGELFPAIPGFNSESPVFKHAAAACGLTGPVGQPHGG
jgi:hypothetical protein